MNSIILRKEPLNKEMTLFALSKPWNFQAGQYTTILFQEKPFYFSIASSPLDPHLEFHIQDNSIHPLDPGLSAFLATATEVELSPPAGRAILTDSDRPLILVAGGSGFAPMKSIIETVLSRQKKRTIHLYWGVRHPASFYLQDIVKNWQQHSHFQYTPVLSEAYEPRYRHGLVHEAVLADYADLSAFDIYLAGPFGMSYAARDAFLQKGATMSSLFSDAFAFS